MTDSNCHAIASRKSPIGQLYSSISERQVPISNTYSAKVNNIELKASISANQDSKFEAELNSTYSSEVSIEKELSSQRVNPELDLRKIHSTEWKQEC